MAKKDNELTDEKKTEKSVVEPQVSAADAAKKNYEEALAEAENQFDFVSQTGDKALISKAAQKVADIKQQELDRLKNLPPAL